MTRRDHPVRKAANDALKPPTAWLAPAQPLEIPAGASLSDLSSVACSSVSACTAVGVYTDSAGASPQLIERWNGTSWTLQTGAGPAGAVTTELEGVSCPSSTQCMAVGSYTGSESQQFTLAERWNGTAWAVESTPNPAGTSVFNLASVSCPTTSFCEAVGTADTTNASDAIVPISLSWNGSSWVSSGVPQPRGGVNAVTDSVACSAASRCTAVGVYEPRPSLEDVPFAERWNGSSWAFEAMPSAAGALSTVDQVACPASSSCFAVGGSQAGSGPLKTYAAHWNGTSWSVMATPNPSSGSSYLLAVACSSSAACTAVGQNLQSASPSPGLVARWDGTSWSLQSSANPSGYSSVTLSSVACPSATECFDAGVVDYGDETAVALTERWS